MKLYFAPLEGITTHIFRKVHANMFDGCDEYYAPFINPSEKEKISLKNLRDITPERNTTVKPKVQVLTNNSDSFMNFCTRIEPMGYNEVNINLGCPSGTVVNKGRGAGFLKDVSGLKKFLDEIFKNNSFKISLKTRIGYSDPGEMAALLDIYNCFPLEELIVHPRVKEQMYKGSPNMEVFDYIYHNSANKLCYNGDVFEKSDYDKITHDYPNIHSVMLGRGALANPALFREIKGGTSLTVRELISFSEALADSYFEILQSDLFTLYKLKELWFYVMWNYPESKKEGKAIKKSKNLKEFFSVIQCLPEPKRDLVR